MGVIFATKSDLEREEAETERLVRKAPKDKPPRHDRRRERIDTEESEDPDPDRSLNYKVVGGSDRTARTIPVRNKETGKVIPGGVTPDTLRRNPSKYERVRPGEESGSAADDEAADAGKKDTPPEATSGEESVEKVVRRWLDSGEHKTPEFHSYLQGMPTGAEDPVTGEQLVLDPVTRKRIPFESLPDNVKADFIKNYQRTKSDQVKERPLQEWHDLAESLSPDVKNLVFALNDPESDASKQLAKIVKTTAPEDLNVDRVFPSLSGKFPAELSDVASVLALAGGVAKYEDQSEAVKAAIPKPVQRPVSYAEKRELLGFLMDSVPPEMATKLFSSGIHPDDAAELVREYKKEMAAPVKSLSAYADNAVSSYTENPEKVPPPKEWGGVAFEALSPEEKATAYRQHQMRVVAKSMAAKRKVSAELAANKIPAVLAGTLADELLTPKTGSPEARRELAQKKSQVMFDSMIEHGQHFEMTNSTVSWLMSQLGPDAQEVARGFLQANDYFSAKQKYLDKFSEYSSAPKILGVLREAESYLDDRAKNYGGDDTAKVVFKNRVLDKLRVLSPEKYSVIRTRIDREDTAAYDTAYAAWEKAHKRWERGLNSNNPYRDRPPIDPEPVAPIKPLRYIEKKSSYAPERMMARKFAIYHGVLPDGRSTPTPWEQIESRTFGSDQIEAILKSARGWLSSELLSDDVEYPTNVRYRMALDYAIAQSNAKQAITPSVYSRLLAELTGDATRRTAMHKNAAHVKNANSILSRLDKLAGFIQDNHAEWGMSREAARTVVNQIDKIADDYEVSAFGKTSFESRQMEVVAAVIQRDSDEPYMDTFANPQKPIQTDADEPYMDAYADDQSSAMYNVWAGK